MLDDLACLDEAGFTVGLSDDGRVATVTLGRPQLRNALTMSSLRALAQLNTALPATVRVVLVQGDGPDFCSGLDRRLLDTTTSSSFATDVAAASADGAAAILSEFQGAFAFASRPGLVSIAVVQGHAIGAGCQLALACDLRIAAPDAHFAIAELQYGLVPDLGGTKRLVELIGYSHAALMCLTGAAIGASKAVEVGLVNAMADGADIDQWVADVIVAVLARPASAIAETKALLLAASQRSQYAAERAEREAQYRQLRLLCGVDD